jgi:(p)ppGpp synthase/HD superfamily hydrolase
MPYRFAKCCNADTLDPRPQSIIGIVTRNGVVNVHRNSCRMAKGGNPERKLKMYWK